MIQVLLKFSGTNLVTPPPLCEPLVAEVSIASSSGVGCINLITSVAA